uniref:NnrS family protein n=1 Tax=uncultured Roseobacter sp. TaxID=114847 RepID=UPI00261125D4
MLAAAVMLVALIGGRIVPAFTRNWLKAQGVRDLPVQPMEMLDKAALLAIFGAMTIWIWNPEAPLAAQALISAGLLHLLRVFRWKGWLAHREPAIWVMHVGYLFVPLGALGIGSSVMSSVQHLWMAGAVGVMTVAVMTRASLGHMGHIVAATAGTTAIYTGVLGAALLRVVADSSSSWTQVVLTVSGLLWIAAFVGLVFPHLSGPPLCLGKRRKDMANKRPK